MNSRAIREVFKGGNISKEEFEKEKANSKGIPDNDIIWGLLNKKLVEYMSKGDWGGMGLIYLDMANFLRVEGRSFFDVLQQSRKCYLMTLKQAGFERASIHTLQHNEPYNSCKACSQLEGKILNIDEALATMPIPMKDCEFSIYGCKKGWCRCLYLPVRN